VHKNSFRFFFSALVAMFSVSICSAQTATDSPTPAVNPEIIARAETPTPVKFRDQTLFEVAMPIGAFTAQERAAAIERRLLVVAKGPASVLGDLRVVERGGLSEIIAGEKLIRTLTDADTAGTGRTRRQLAAGFARPTARTRPMGRAARRGRRCRPPPVARIRATKSGCAPGSTTRA
jgi:hypothetical protein